MSFVYLDRTTPLKGDEILVLSPVLQLVTYEWPSNWESNSKNDGIEEFETPLRPSSKPRRKSRAMLPSPSAIGNDALRSALPSHPFFLPLSPRFSRRDVSSGSRRGAAQSTSTRSGADPTRPHHDSSAWTFHGKPLNAFLVTLAGIY